MNAPAFSRYSILAAFRRLSNGVVDVSELTASGIGYLVLPPGERRLAIDEVCAVWTRDIELDSPRKTVLSAPFNVLLGEAVEGGDSWNIGVRHVA